MRAVRANGKVELKQELVGCDAPAVIRTAVLGPNLAELARPVREKYRFPPIALRRVQLMVRLIVPNACIPPSRELVFTQPVITKRRLVRPDVHVFPAPDELGPRLEPLVDRTAQRTIAERRV